MKTAICVLGYGLNAVIASTLLKAEYYIVIDSENDANQEKIVNHYNNVSTGADIFISQLLISKGVNIVVCGSCENNALKLFKEANVEILNIVSGSVSEYLNSFYPKNKPMFYY